MGKRGGKKFSGGRGGRNRGGGAGGAGHRDGRADSWRMNFKEVAKENARFEEYYNHLGLVSEDERESFWDALKRDLPNSFRFAGSKGHALSVQKRLKEHYIPQICAMDHFQGEEVTPPFPLMWYPNELAWAMTTPKSTLRRHPPFASFQRFLVSETSVGNISRQEAVSMIPPLLMDIKPGMTVLDLCAAPGSKAAQLIEMVHAGEETRTAQVLKDLADGKEYEATNDEHLWTDDGRSTGLLIANDADYKRSHMLIHQMKRLNSPNLIVMNHDATQFPSIKLARHKRRPGQVEKDVPNRYLKFDRILADVPCSGDGTMRKNVNIWKDWNPSNAMGLHITQVRILVRALQMLKVGGRVVYSTCSMNPVENEAVIVSAIDRCGGLSKVTIKDCSNELPELKRVPGLNSWSVMDRTGRIWKDWPEVEAHREIVGSDGLGRMSEGMFPPTTTAAADMLPLNRCMRIYGHLQDTGAFFITVLEKMSEIRTRPEVETRVDSNASVQSSLSTEMPSRPDLAAPIRLSVDNTAVEELSEDPLHKDQTENLIVPLLDVLESNSPIVVLQNEEKSEPDTLKRSIDALDDEAEALVGSKKSKLCLEVGSVVPGVAKEDEDHSAALSAAPLSPSKPPDSNIAAQESSMQTKQVKPTSKPKKNSQPFEEPFKYLAPSHSELEGIYAFYGLSPRFPRNRFLVRNAAGEPSKTIYYSSELAKEILVENEGKGIKFVHCGVKMFMKQDTQKLNNCKWRIQTEGMQIIEGWVGPERVIMLSRRETLRKLLVEMFPRVNNDGWQSLGEIGERVRDIGTGCCVLRIEASDDEDGLSERMVMPIWKSLYSLNLMLPKEERSAMLLRIFNDTTPLEHTSFGDKLNSAKAESETNETLEENQSSLPEVLELSDRREGAQINDKVDVTTSITERETVEQKVDAVSDQTLSGQEIQIVDGSIA